MNNGLRAKGKAIVSGLEVEVLPQVQGLNSTPDELTLAGRAWRTLIGDAVIDEPMLERTTEGASTVTIDLHDPHGKLLAHPLLKETYDVELDDLAFTKVKVSRKDSSTLELTFEDAEVALLRGKKGARKALPGTTSIAQFGLSLVREVKPPIPYYSPELLHPKQLKSAKAARAAEPQQAATRQPGGLTTKSGVTVKHAAASAAQINILNQGLDTARSMHANERVMISLVMTGTQESDVSILHGSGGYGWLSQLKNGAWPASGDVPRDSRAYLQHAIRNDKANPHQSLAALCQSVQASANGSLYAAWETEATNTVHKYMGVAGSASAASDTGSRSQAQALERKKNENTWDCLGRLTDDVGWRRFCSARMVYVLAETDLLASAPRLVIDDDTPGLINKPTFDEDDNKAVSEVNLTVLTTSWGAPPGTVVQLGDSMGPAAGLFVVSNIRSPISERKVSADVTLARPQAPHAPQSSSQGGKGKGKTKLRTPGTGGADQAAQFVAYAKSQIGVTEGSSKQRQYASSLGLSASLPWCSIFVAYCLKQTSNLPLPSNPAYSGGWLSWRGGSKVNTGSLQPGDLIVYDWGDGGQTDHVAIYVGHGQRVGGNQSNRVSQESAMLSAAVGCVRPHWSN